MERLPGSGPGEVGPHTCNHRVAATPGPGAGGGDQSTVQLGMLHFCPDFFGAQTIKLYVIFNSNCIEISC